jgi:6,7-dimethyl-8-ribityllumazine synthase
VTAEKTAPALRGSAAAFSVAVVAARFNAALVDRLVESALAALEELGLPREQVSVWRTPGAFELPLLVREVIRARRPDAVIALGAVVRGATPHFEYVAGEAARGIAEVSRRSGVPVAFGVITADTWAQAEERTRPPLDRGAEAARAAVEMASTLARLRGAAALR